MILAIALSLALSTPGQACRGCTRFRSTGTNTGDRNQSIDYTTGLFARYTMSDSTDGTIEDSGPNGLSLPVTMDGLFPTRTTDGAFGVRLFSRAGTSGATSVPTNYARLTKINQAIYQAFAGGPFTIAFWYKRTAAGGGEGTGTERLVVIGGDAVSGSGANSASVCTFTRTRTAANGGQGQFAITWADAAGATVAPSTYNAVNPGADDTWKHYAVTMTRGASGKSVMILYVDGVDSGNTGDQNEPRAWTEAPATGAIAIGRPALETIGTTGQVGGSMRDLRLYSRALTAADILGLYGATR